MKDGRLRGMTKRQALRSELQALRARYDDGAVSPAIYARIKQLEAEIAWLDHGGADQRGN